MWKRWSKLARTCAVVAVAVVLVLATVLSVLWLWWIMLPLLILSSLCGFVVSRFDSRQREWKDSVQAGAWAVRWSEIRQHPIRYWVWTIGLFAFLLYTLVDADAVFTLTESSSVPIRLFWPALIVFTWSCGLLFLEAIAWRDFGATYFLSESAFSPGGKIAGHIHFQRESPIPYALVSRVQCIRHLIRDGEEYTTTLWSSERKIYPKEFGIGPTGRCIPIDFDLPSSALESSKGKKERIEWELSVKHIGWWPRKSDGRSRVPYEDRFQIPVARVQQPYGSLTR